MFSYNVSQNSTTDYSQYYLLLGTNLTLPVDVLFGENQSDDSDGPFEEWIDAHQEHLRYAYDKAGERTHDHVEYRKTVHDHKRFNQELCVGDKVYTIRKRGVRGRNKIQNTWDSIIYRVLRLS